MPDSIAPISIELARSGKGGFGTGLFGNGNNIKLKEAVMITISHQAIATLWETLQESGIPDDRALRLQSNPEGFRLEIDMPSEDDRVIRHRDTPVLIIDGAKEDEFDDMLIDVTDGIEGRQLTIRPLPPPDDNV
jgi:hypothetical protein